MPELKTYSFEQSNNKEGIYLHKLISMVYSAIKSQEQFLDIDQVERPAVSNGFALLKFNERNGNPIRFFLCIDGRYFGYLNRYNYSGFERKILVTYANHRKAFDGLTGEKWYSGRDGSEALVVLPDSEMHLSLIPQAPFPVYEGIDPVSFFECMRAVLGYRKSYGFSVARLILLNELMPFRLGINGEDLSKTIDFYLDTGIKSGIITSRQGKLMINGKAFRSPSITAKYYFGYMERARKKSLYDF